MPEHPAGWYPDPTSRHQYRYWDGRAWTDHVGDGGVTSTDPFQPAPPAAQERDDGLDEAQVREILGEAGVQPTVRGDGTLFGEPVLIVYQWVTDLGESLRYSIVGPAGTVVGRCQEHVVNPDPGETPLSELIDNANTDRVTFADPSGTAWAQLAHKKVWKSKVTMTDPAGREIGSLQQENVLGKVRLGLEASGQKLGRVVSDDTQLLGFTISDRAENQVGRLVKLGRYAQPGVFGPRRVRGLYVLHLRTRPAQPLHSLAIAAPVAVDLAFSVVQAGQRSAGRTVTGH